MFGSKHQPKKKKLPAGEAWTCGCDIQQPRYILFCSKCEKGQKKQKEGKNE